MKKILFAAIATLAAMSALGQELTVTYRATYNTSSPTLFAEQIPNEAMRSSLAAAYRDVVMTYRLKYRNGKSEFRIVPGEGKQEITFMGQTMDVNAAAVAQAQNYSYKDHAAGVAMDKVSVFGRDFVVCDSIAPRGFSTSAGEREEILGYECQKAVSPDGKTTIWYTPHIPIADEPVINGLKGLALRVDDGNMTFTAVEILDSVDTDIVRPEGGTAMGKREFDEMVKKRIEMMRRN